MVAVILLVMGITIKLSIIVIWNCNCAVKTCDSFTKTQLHLFRVLLFAVVLVVLRVVLVCLAIGRHKHRVLRLLLSQVSSCLGRRLVWRSLHVGGGNVRVYLARLFYAVSHCFLAGKLLLFVQLLRRCSRKLRPFVPIGILAHGLHVVLIRILSDHVHALLKLFVCFVTYNGIAIALPIIMQTILDHRLTSRVVVRYLFHVQLVEPLVVLRVSSGFFLVERS